MSRNGIPQRDHEIGAPATRPPRRTDEGVLHLLQLTDLHLYADPNGCLLGQNTRMTLELVLELAQETYWPVDRVLLTGDLVHDESPAGYRYVEERFARLKTPCNGLPGNHDTSEIMAESLHGGVIGTAPNVLSGDWNLIFLDSTIPGGEGGHLDGRQLTLLETSLATHPQAHGLVCLHHQPVLVGSQWIDTMALDNSDAFFAIIDRNPQVRGVIWGHVHQEFGAERNGVALLGAPSTCIQFLPGSKDFAVDALPPGFRWLALHPDGRIDTGIERIADYPVPMDLTTRGY